MRSLWNFGRDMIVFFNMVIVASFSMAVVFVISFIASRKKQAAFDAKLPLIKKDLVDLVQGTPFNWCKLIVGASEKKLVHVWAERFDLTYDLTRESLDLSESQKSFLIEKGIKENDLRSFLEKVDGVFKKHVDFEVHCFINIDISYCTINGDVMFVFFGKAMEKLQNYIKDLGKWRLVLCSVGWVGFFIYCSSIPNTLLYELVRSPEMKEISIKFLSKSWLL